MPPAWRPVSAYVLARSMLVVAGWGAPSQPRLEGGPDVEGAGGGSSGSSSGSDVHVFSNEDIQDMGDAFFSDFGGTKTWTERAGACGWGCAGAVDDHDNGEAQAELRAMSLSSNF